MTDTWNAAILNPEIQKVDSWNPAELNNFVKRKDTWNTAELNDYVVTKRDLEAIREAAIQNGIAHFMTYESDPVISISGEIEGEIKDFHIIQDTTTELPEFNNVYNYQPIPQTGGRTKQLIPKLIGGSVVWNQLVKTQYKSGTITPNGTHTFSYKIVEDSRYVENHLYFISVNVGYNGNKTLRGYCLLGTVYGAPAQDITGTSKRFKWIAKPTASGNNLQIGLSNINTSDKLTTSDEWTYDNLQFIDLTQALGTTIANYIYTLEQNTSGSGVAWFRKYFPEVYYAYSDPTIQSTKVSGKKVVGKNLFDPDTLVTVAGATKRGDEYDVTLSNNMTLFTIPYPLQSKQMVLSYKYKTNTSAVNCYLYLIYTDGTNERYVASGTANVFNAVTIVSNASKQIASVRVGKYNSGNLTTFKDIQLEIGSSATDYEPYTTTTYDLSGSHLVKRNYEYRAYASGDESLPDTITDGTNTVTKRVTPITETVTNPTLYGIWKLDANNNL